MAIVNKEGPIVQSYTSQWPHKGQREAWNYHLPGHCNFLLKAGSYNLVGSLYPSVRPSLVAQKVKNPPEFDPWVGKIPWRRAWQPTPVFLPGESPWMEEPGGLQSMGLQRVGHDLATNTQTWIICVQERSIQKCIISEWGAFGIIRRTWVQESENTRNWISWRNWRVM